MEHGRRRRLVAAQWQTWVHEYLHPDTPRYIREWLREVYFDGARAAVCGVMRFMSHEAEPTEEDYRIAEDLHAELHEDGQRTSGHSPKHWPESN